MDNKEEDNYSKLSTEEKCAHKNWKARCEGYGELNKILNEIDEKKTSEWSKYGNLVKKFPLDTNAAAQEKGLETTLLFLENTPIASVTPRIITDIMESIVTKCVIALKAKSRELATNIALMCVELEKSDIVQEEVMKGLENKNPKVVAACVAILQNCVAQFGPKVLNIKSIVKKMQSLVEERDKTVRDESKKFIVELHRWIGPAFKTQLNTMRPVLLQEIEAEVLKMSNEKTTPTRFLRSEQAKRKIQEETECEDAENQPVAESNVISEDPLGFIEAFDVLANMPGDFYEKLDNKKWQERKEALDKLDGMLSANPKLENGDYSDLVRKMIHVLVKDPHIVVATLAAKVIMNLAKGLGKKFTNYSPQCLVSIFEKFKEKKASVVAVLRDASDACFAATTLEVIQESALQALQNKNPVIKQEMSLFMVRCFSKTSLKVFNDKKLMKPYFSAIFSNINVSDPNVRDSAAEAIGIALKIVGEKALSPFLQELDAMKLQKVKDFAENAVIKSPKESNKPRESVAKMSGDGTGTVEVVALKSDQTKPKKKKSIEQISKSNSIDVSHSISEVTVEKNSVDISATIAPILSELSNKDWKLRDEGLKNISKILEKHESVQSNLGELPQLLIQRLQDSNRNIGATTVTVCQKLATALGRSCKKYTSVLIPSLLSTLSDSKANIRASVISCLDTWAENGGLNEFFQGFLLSEALKAGNALLRTELFSWISEKLENSKNVSRDELSACLPILYECLEGKTPQERKNGQEAIFPFMKHLGYEIMLRATEKLRPNSSVTVKGFLDKERQKLISQSDGTLKSGSSTKVLKTTPEIDQNQNVVTNPAKKGKSSTFRIEKGRPAASLPTVDEVQRVENSNCYLPVNTKKSQRFADESKQKLLMWNFTSPRGEFTDLLKELMTSAGLNKTLITNMFHTDFKFHLKALETLTLDLNSNGRHGAVSNLDLILKWLAIRFFDTNPSVLIKSLDYLQMLFEDLDKSLYRLMDIEVYSFAPYLMLKLGDSKDSIRANVHNIIRLMCRLYSPHKMCTHILDGLKSKNARQRTECLEEIAVMIPKHGMKILNPSTGLKEIAKQISDRDTGVRNAALNALVQAYFLEETKIYKMIGQLNAKDQSLLDERVKRAKKPQSSTPKKTVEVAAAKKVVSVPVAAVVTPKSPPSARQNYTTQPIAEELNTTFELPSPKSEDIQKIPFIEQETVSENQLPAKNVLEDKKKEDKDIASTTAAKSRSVNSAKALLGKYYIDFEKIDNMFGPEDNLPLPPLKLFDTNIDDILNEEPIKLPERKCRIRSVLSSGPDAKVVPQIKSAIAGLDFTILQTGSLEMEVVIESLLNLDVMVSDLKYHAALSEKMSNVLAMAISQFRRIESTILSILPTKVKDDINQYFICVLNTLKTMFAIKEIALGAARDGLKDFVYFLLLIITDPNINYLPDCKKIVKEINCLVFRVVENSNPVAIICALVGLLNEVTLYTANVSSTRITGLVLKGLWKVIKQMGVWANDVENYDWNLKPIFEEFHCFLTNHPFASYIGQDEMPIRTLKTVMHSLIMTVGVSKVAVQLFQMPDFQNGEAGAYISKVVRRETGRPSMEIRRKSYETSMKGLKAPDDVNGNSVPVLVPVESTNIGKGKVVNHPSFTTITSGEEDCVDTDLMEIDETQ